MGLSSGIRPSDFDAQITFAHDGKNLIRVKGQLLLRCSPLYLLLRADRY